VLIEKGTFMWVDGAKYTGDLIENELSGTV